MVSPNAYIIAESEDGSWEQKRGLVDLLMSMPVVFGERVAISPDGRIIVVSGDDYENRKKVEVFYKGFNNDWRHDVTLNEQVEGFGHDFVADDNFVVVASERKVYFYPRQINIDLEWPRILGHETASMSRKPTEVHRVDENEEEATLYGRFQA